MISFNFVSYPLKETSLTTIGHFESVKLIKTVCQSCQS